MQIDTNEYRVRYGNSVGLPHRVTTGAAPEKIENALQPAPEHARHASEPRALLLIFRALDAVGRDSASQHEMLRVNPQGCLVFSVKHPSVGELKYDCPWRTTQELPEHWRIR